MSRSIDSLPRPRVHWPRIVGEAVAGLTQRPGRALLTALGTVLGIGSFVAVLGITSTANGQIEHQFTSLVATEVGVSLVNSSGLASVSFPSNAEHQVERIKGVEHAGISWDVSAVSASEFAPGLIEGSTSSFRVRAATAGYWDVVHPTLDAGRVFDGALSEQRVAVVGEEVAHALHIGDLTRAPVVYINNYSFVVIGVAQTTERSSDALSSVTIPGPTAERLFGQPGTAAQMTIETSLGAADVVARQAPYAIDPANADLFKATAPPNPQIVRNQVSASIQVLFLALAAICLLVGAVGISNASLLAVMARVPEIGLRRSLGALPSHIAGQFLIENSILGGLGGVIGASAGLASVVVVALLHSWTPVISLSIVLAAPIGGAIIGLLAGLYPALRASRIEPVEALRS